MLGLDNAATPMGLKAMTELQELNPDKETASNAQIMFLVLNTSGLTLIPITVMNYRNQYDAVNPSDVFIPILICTFFASLVGLIVVSLYQKINLFNKVVLSYLVGLTAIIAGMLWYFTSLNTEELQAQSSLISNIILYGIICTFIIMALVKKVNVYEAFIEGAKGGFDIAIKIIPYLVAILVSIGVFRASGALDYLTQGLEWFFGLFLTNTEFVEALPTAFMKPLSGTGARGMMIDAFNAHGVDSFIARLSATFQGATDTTFYIIAVYFGSVGIKKTRYAIKAGLLADFAGIVAAVVVASLFFGGETTTNYSNTEIIHNFTQEWNADHQSKFLSDEFTFTDQTFESKTLEEMAVDFPELKESHLFEKEIEDNSVIFYKSTINNTTNSFKIVVDKQKIQSIQLMGNFED
jgi:spore maturation protein SpmB